MLGLITRIRRLDRKLGSLKFKKERGEGMGKILKIIGRFLTDQKFREEPLWMKWIAKKLSIFHQHVWTSFRFPAGILVIVINEYNLWLGLISFILFALTDMADGMVARYKRQQNGRFGALLDATADKSFALPLLYYWGKALSPTPVFYAELVIMVVIEFGNGLLWILEKKGFVESSILYEHLLSGKFKFVFQIILIGILWHACFIFPAWPYWESILYSLMGMIILLAYKSVAGKINRLRSMASK